MRHTGSCSPQASGRLIAQGLCSIDGQDKEYAEKKLNLSERTDTEGIPVLLVQMHAYDRDSW